MIDFSMQRNNEPVEALGFLPQFFSEADPRPAVEQADSNYQHGGGWRPFVGFWMPEDGSYLSYPEDRPLELIAEAKLHDEKIRVYELSWVAVVQPDGTYEISRMD